MFHDHRIFHLFIWLRFDTKRCPLWHCPRLLTDNLSVARGSVWNRHAINLQLGLKDVFRKCSTKHVKDDMFFDFCFSHMFLYPAHCLTLLHIQHPKEFGRNLSFFRDPSFILLIDFDNSHFHMSSLLTNSSDLIKGEAVEASYVVKVPSRNERLTGCGGTKPMEMYVWVLNKSNMFCFLEMNIQISTWLQAIDEFIYIPISWRTYTYDRDKVILGSLDSKNFQCTHWV